MKYILQHTGPWSLAMDRNVSNEDIDRFISGGSISGGGEMVIKLKDKVYKISKRRIQEIIAEDFLYSSRSNEPEAHFIKGVKFGKHISKIENILSERDKENLLNIFPDGNLKFWGSKNGVDNRTKRKIKKIEAGDRLIFLSTFGVQAVCEVAYLIMGNSELGLAFWYDADYENTIFLKNIKKDINFNLNELKKILKLKQNYNKISMHIVESDYDGFFKLDCIMDEIFNNNKTNN